MEIIEFYYDDSEQILEIMFTINDDDEHYRSLSLPLETIMYYSPSIIEEEDIIEGDEDFFVEILEEYFKQNDIPESELY